jgi:hydrogenase maturation protease
MNHPKTLILGYGNIDRQDDGVAWHTMAGIASFFCDETPEPDGEYHHSTIPAMDYLFVLQLAPEISEELAQYDRICFIDAHTGAIPQPVEFAAISCEFQTSPFTHHLTPQTLLELTKSLYHSEPEAMLLSIRGYQFGFSQKLSRQTRAHIKKAITMVSQWIELG